MHFHVIGPVIALLMMRGSIYGLASTISEIGYILLPSRNMAEIAKSSKQTINTAVNSVELGNTI